MSHFSVLVITDQPGEESVTKALAPYHEFECTGRDDQYVVDLDITDECRKDFETHQKDARTFQEFIKGWHGYSVAQSDGGVATLLKEHTYGYFLLGADGDVAKVVRRTNPNKHWDWYQIGGRWTGFFKTKPNVCGIVGSPGLMTSHAKPGYADQVFKSDVDIEGMRDEAEAEAKRNYALYHSVVDAHPSIIQWDAMREKFPGNIDQARKAYHEQPGVMALRSNKETAWFEPDRFTLDLQGHCLRARNAAMRTFAVLKDGTWYEKGSMGWWGMVSDESSEEEWSTQFAMLIDTLPDTAVLTLVDCHI